MNLFNSMVRGFGSQIGRTAANEVIRSKNSLGKTLLYLLFGACIGIGIIGGLAYLGSQTDEYKKSHAEYLAKEKADSLNKANLNLEYYKGHIVYTGKRGGKYYYGKKGKKIYIH